MAGSPRPAWLDPGTSARHEPQHLPAQQRAGGPSAPHCLSWPCPLQGFGELQKSRSGGEGWRRKGEQIAEEQKRRERNEDLSRCLHPPDAHHIPKGIYPVLPVSTSHGGRTCAVSLAALNLCCSPRWEKPELTQEQPAEVMHLPSKRRTEKTLPHLLLLTNPSDKAVCVCELLIQNNAKFVHHFPSCIATNSLQCPRLSPMGTGILQGYC